MRVRIEATELPGRTCGPGDDFPGHDGIHVGVQRRGRPGELLDLHPGDAPSASMFRRAKLMLDGEGAEVRAAVRPPLVDWSAER
ncbi:hypothetical protein GCM10010191_26370 [Actinomadura vinacea]|uniref:Uncharacterized protein n=1 Tax=Actinomadura vinacea TaxID=115336 RepID=A0ABN3IWY8_9ACTN